MNAKHLTKNAMSRKLVFLAAGIALAIIAAFSICATSQAKADDNVANDSIVDSKFYSKIESSKTRIYTKNNDKFSADINGRTLKDMHEEIDEWPEFDYCRVILGYNDWVPETHYYIQIEFWQNGASGYENYFGIEFYIPEDVNLQWKYENGDVVDYGDELLKNKSYNFIFGDAPITSGINVSGVVIDAATGMPVPFANVVYCQYNPWWGMYLPVEGVEAVKTDMWGWYTIEGITEEMLPGKVFIYDGIKQIGESEPIWFFPEGMETLYMWPIVINQEQPDPPVPPTPPDPPVPPGPNPPEPVPPVPPVPTPTPDNPGGGIAQTSDNTVSALVIFAMVALLGAGVLTGRKLYNR